MRTKQDIAAEAGAKVETPHLLNLCRCVTNDSPFPLVATEGQSHIVLYANPAFCRLAGRSREELVGHSFAESIPEGVRNGCSALLDRVYRTGETEALADQEHSLSAATEVYWSYAAWPMLDEEQHPQGVMLQVSDTTEAASLRERLLTISEAIVVAAMRQHEQVERAAVSEMRLHRVMRESDHRIKNHLQSIGALVDIQAMANTGTFPVSELLQIRNYLATIASIHDLLTGGLHHDHESGALSVKEILEQLLPMLQQIVGMESIQWNADDTRLPIKQGISLAVIVNELVTNAVKHGGARVELEVVASDRNLTLTFCDDGPGFPEGFDPRTASNYGLELLETVSRIELGGTITYQNRAGGGACFTIAFPVPVTADDSHIIL